MVRAAVAADIINRMHTHEERTMHPQMKILRNLSPADKLQLVEELWDDLTNVPTPEWHKEEIRSRAAELDADPSIAITQEEMWRRVDSST